MLTELNHDFSVIGLTETKYVASRSQFINITIPSYNFDSQPSLSNAGGVGFFVSDKLSYTIRNDISQVTLDYESLWIEIQSNLHHNRICGVIYRHPKSNLKTFMNSLNNVMDKINRENKYCIIMGDFNVNLLNSESHLATDEFLSNLGIYFFNPRILKPTRITLIDNIFFNSIVHHTISGNIIHDLTDHLPNFLIPHYLYINFIEGITPI